MVEVGLRRLVTGDGLAVSGDPDLRLCQGLMRDIGTPMEQPMCRFAGVHHWRGASPALGLGIRPFVVQHWFLRLAFMAARHM